MLQYINDNIKGLDRRLSISGVSKQQTSSSKRTNVFKRNEKGKTIINPVIEANKIKLAESETLDLISKIMLVKISEIRESKIFQYIEWIILINQNAKKQKAEADKQKKK